MLEDSVFKVAELLASRVRKTRADARHPALLKRVNFPSLQQFLAFTKHKGNAESTILKHRLEEYNNAYKTSRTAEETPLLAASLRLRPHLVNQRFRFQHDRVPASAAKMKEYFSSLHPPFAPNLSPSFPMMKGFVTGHFEVNPGNALSFVRSQRMLAVLLRACCEKQPAKMCGTPYGYSKPSKSNGRYISLSLTIDKSDQVRIT